MLHSMYNVFEDLDFYVCKFRPGLYLAGNGEWEGESKELRAFLTGDYMTEVLEK